MFHKLVYFLGVRLRSPELIDKYNFLKKTENWSLEELENYQLERLQRLLQIAYTKSDFYYNLFIEAGIDPANIKSLDDLNKIPTITKTDLLLNKDKIQNIEGYKKLFYSETSGSTGEPLSFFRNSEWDAGHRAAQLRGYSWYDVKPWELNGYFWGYRFGTRDKIKTKIYDLLLNRFRLFSYNEIDLLKFLKKLKKATYLEGYSSMIYEVSKIINENFLGKYDLKLVKGTSEKIYDTYQSEVIKAFGNKMVSEYGAAEAGIIAFECKEGNMHITMENVIVEEENGEVIITNLLSDSFPIIRYKLGDSIVLDNHTVCKCGMKHKIISNVLGRVGKSIYGVKNKYPSLTLYYIFKNLNQKYGITINFQANQKEIGKLEINLDRNISKIEFEKLKLECDFYFSDDLSVEIYPNNLKRDYSEKFRDFISEIDK